MNISYSTTDTPFGTMAISKSKNGICSILFPEEKPFKSSLKNLFPDSAIYKETTDSSNITSQLDEYFKGIRFNFEMKLDLSLPKFFSKVLKAVSTIPFGQTASYKDVAIKCGNLNASRAVGNANAKNPVPIIVPCHRVIKHNGNIGGYGGKLERKFFLIEHEKRYSKMIKL